MLNQAAVSRSVYARQCLIQLQRSYGNQYTKRAVGLSRTVKRVEVQGRTLQGLQKIDFTPASLNPDDIDPRTAVADPDYVDNNIADVGLREVWSGLSVDFVAVTVKYADGSLMDIPINATYLRNPNPTGQLQTIRYRRHTPTGKIVPETWRGRPENLPDDRMPEGSVFFARDIPPAIMRGYNNAIARRAFAFSGEIAQIWGAVLAVRGAIQIFSAAQSAAIARAASGATGGGLVAARAAAQREAARQALEAEKRALIAELRAAGIRFSESEIVQIVRTVGGRIVWLERGNANAGLQHIMTRHGSQFAQLGVQGEENVARLIMETLRTQAPTAARGGGQAFSVMMGGVRRLLRIVVGSNGFVVTAHPL
jgi:hypothetical protein